MKDRLSQLKIMGCILIKGCSLLILLGCISFSFAQTNADSLAFYFDDDGISVSKNIVKVNAAAVVNGDLPIHYERVLGNVIGLEVGIGLLLPYYLPDLIELTAHLSGESILIKDPGFGRSLWGQLKYYYADEGVEGRYIGFQYRTRKYKQPIQPAEVVHSDIVVNFGGQYIIGKRMLLDASLGLGNRFRRETTSSGEITKETALVMPLAIKLGYLF